MVVISSLVRKIRALFHVCKEPIPQSYNLLLRLFLLKGKITLITVYWLTRQVLSINLFSAIQYPVIFIKALLRELSSFSIMAFIRVHDLHRQQLTKP